MFKLEDYQKAMVRTILERNQLLLVSPMGSGKTVSTLAAVTTLLLRSQNASSSNIDAPSRVKNVLIIAPKRVAQNVWVQEASSLDMGLNIRFCKTALDIALFLRTPEPHHIAVCSVTRIDEIPNGCWDVVIIDESTMFGNKSSKRSKEARRICKGVNRRLLLTGTPIHGGYEKLWHQIFLIDGGLALGKTLTAFREGFMRVKYNVNGVVTVWEVNPPSIPIIHERIKDLVYIVRNAVKMPDALYKVIKVDLPQKRLDEYRMFEKESILEFTSERGTEPFASSKTLAAFAASSRGIKLRQLASGCVYADETNKTFSVTHTEKIEALKELLELNESPLLVVYSFISELTMIREHFPMARKLDTEQDIADWNAKKIPLAMVHPASVGHGLNLQFGGHVVVWYSLTYDAELYAQTNKRLDRRGQTEIVSIIHLITRDTIDEKVLKVIREKENQTKDFI